MGADVRTLALLATEADGRDTAPSTTIVPRGPDVQATLGLLAQMAGAPMLASQQFTPGGLLGEGGMGVVHAAEQVALHRTVAIKTLRARWRTPEAAEALLREAWITGSLEHPNIVPVHQLGLDEAGMPSMVLKRVEGIEWSKLIGDAEQVTRRYGATDLLAWNLAILLQVLNAIRFAHSRGILHRDLKPANVMIGDFGEVYLLDWGIAVSLRDDGSGRLPLAREATAIAGTPCYMAPEMLQPDGDAPLSERTDVYLAGAVLFEIVTGRPPHRGRTALEVMTSVLTGRPEVPASVPAELAAICARAMASEPAERYASADELRVALQVYLDHRGSDHLLHGALARLDELEAQLARPSPDRARHREEAYRLFGACRFGFLEALAVWRDNATARAGLRRAIVAVAEYELATGDPQAAVTLLGELDDLRDPGDLQGPPALLQHAREAAARHVERQRALEALDYTHDPAVGGRQRSRLAGTLGAVFVAGSIGAATIPVAAFSYWIIVGWSLGCMGLTAGWAWFGRARLMTTLINRRFLVALFAAFAFQLLLVLCTWQMGLGVTRTLVLMLFLWAVIAGCVASMIETRRSPTAIAYAVACAVAAFEPGLVLWLMAAANLVFALNTRWVRRLPPR